MEPGQLGVLLALLAQTAAAAIVLGKLMQMVKQHDDYIRKLSDWKHDVVTPRLYRVDEMWRERDNDNGDNERGRR